MLTFLLVKRLFDVHPILIDLVGHNPYNECESTAPTFDDFRALLALEAEALLRHLDCATPCAAAAGDYGVPRVVHRRLNWGQLGILQGRVRIIIGIQRVIELLPIVLLNVGHEVLNYNFNFMLQCLQASLLSYCVCHREPPKLRDLNNCKYPK
jgi:hypothetical protein